LNLSPGAPDQPVPQHRTVRWICIGVVVAVSSIILHAVSAWPLLVVQVMGETPRPAPGRTTYDPDAS